MGKDEGRITKDERMERLSELESENLMSRLWEGLWERIIMSRRDAFGRIVE